MLDNPSHCVSQENVHKTVYIADLPKDINIAAISEYFEKRLSSQPQITIKRPIFSRFYYAYVTFDTIEAAQKCQKEIKFPRFINSSVMSRVLPYSTNRKIESADGQSNSVFVKGFEGANWTPETLYARFCEFGQINDCKVTMDEKQNYLGYGKVQFSKTEDAQKAIQEVSVCC